MHENIECIHQIRVFLVPQIFLGWGGLFFTKIKNFLFVYDILFYYPGGEIDILWT